MAVATLDGRPLLNGPISWTLRSGVAPSRADFEMMPSDAEALMQGGLRPVTLKLASPGADGSEFTNLYVLQIRPADTPKTLLVRVVDRRHFWTSKHVNRLFNARRNVGIKRVPAGFDVPELSPLEPKILYGPWSLNGGVEWAAKPAIEAIFETIKESEKDASGVTPSLVIESDIASFTGKTLPLQDMELADDGAAAMQRLLNFIPGAEVTVDADGTVRVYSIASGAEESIMRAMEDEQDGGGHAMPISNARLRPSEVRVLFAPEVELRFDFEEHAPGSTFEPPGSNDTFMDNVLPVPDYSLNVPGIGKVAQGTWITINQALRAWSTDGSGINLSLAAVRKAMVPGLDLWTGLRLSQLGNSAADWASRVGALQTHYRRTYRIHQQIVARVRSIRAYRTATINPQTGSRAPATAFQDWAIVATQRFLATQLQGGAGKFAYCQNVDGYPSSNLLDSSAIVSPIEVRVTDPDQGIVSLTLKTDPFRVREQFLPSKVTNIPTGAIKAGLVAWNSLEPGQAPPELSANHKVSIILTVVPAAPNSQERLFRVTRKPNDVASLLPSTLKGGLNDAKGPPLEVFVGPGWEMARIAWVDRQESRIKNALGFGSAEAKGDVTSLADLVVNAGPQKGIGNAGASLDAIANSIAASIYAGHADRIEGSRTKPVTHAARIAGFVETALHSVMPDGVSTSTVTVMGQKSPFDLMSMMPTHTRKIILKLASSGKAGA